MEASDSRDQVQRLLAFLEPVLSLPTQADRIKAYHETWMRLNPAAEHEVWKPNMGVNYPWSRGKVDLWRTLRRDVESKFKTALSEFYTGELTDREIDDSNMPLNFPWRSGHGLWTSFMSEHLNGEFIDSPRSIVNFSFMDYSEMLMSLLGIFLRGLDKYIDTQDAISAVSDDMDAYPEDMRYLLEKGMRTSRVKRAQEFMDVLLFMHAVPQRADGKWDALDHESDVTWFREHCEVYQKNGDLMAFLRDCAVVVLLVGYLHAAPGVLSLHACYTQLRENALPDKTA